MALFLIMAEDDSIPADIQKLVDREFPDSYKINKRCWVISLKGFTTEKVARKLNVAVDDDDDGEGKTEGVVIMRATPSYWGNANTQLWDWLKAHVEKPDG
jgi:hypothetical protein